MADYPKLSAMRLYDEIRKAGYQGGYGRVRDHVREIRPREMEEEAVRFETPPGRQGQVDFASFGMAWGRRHALVVVLGFSRLLWLRFYRRQTMETLFDGLESAFGYFGGVPREMLFDQMRSVVVSDRRTDGGRLTLNEEFLRFSSHWGFAARSCRPYRAQTKGKVERPIRYLRESFCYGRQFLNDEDLNEQAAHWLEDTANVRVHGTTGERPADRFKRAERHALHPLAVGPYRRLGAPEAALKARERVQAARPPAAVEVERRPLRTYAEVAQ